MTTPSKFALKAARAIAEQLHLIAPPPEVAKIIDAAFADKLKAGDEMLEALMKTCDGRGDHESRHRAIEAWRAAQ
jgi:hypothetical protein